MATWGSPDWPSSAANGESQDAKTAVSGAGWGAPPPPAVAVPDTEKPEKTKLGTGKRLRLEKSSQVRAEMVRVYRELRAGLIEPALASKLIYSLTELSRLIEREAVEALEARLQAMERGR